MRIQTLILGFKGLKEGRLQEPTKAEKVVFRLIYIKEAEARFKHRTCAE